MVLLNRMLFIVSPITTSSLIQTSSYVCCKTFLSSLKMAPELLIMELALSWGFVCLFEQMFSSETLTETAQRMFKFVVSNGT